MYRIGLLFWVFFIPIVSSVAQIEMAKGDLPSLYYRFTGPTHYKQNPSLVHALAYVHKTEVGQVYAHQRVDVKYRVEKIANEGFVTYITLIPKKPQGHLSFYDFYAPSVVLPLLDQLKLYYQIKELDFVYVKSFDSLELDQDIKVLQFRHQRFSPQWELKLDDIIWKEQITTEEFLQKWDWYNDYEAAGLLLKEEALCLAPTGNAARLLYKQRWLAIYQQLENLAFYQGLIHKDKEDPAALDRALHIREFVLQREIEVLNNKLLSQTNQVSVEDVCEAYIQVENDFFKVLQKNTSLYADLLFEFNPAQKELFCFPELVALFNKLSWGDKEWRSFELLYQKYNIEKIDQLIISKQPKEALFQLDKFEAFYSYATFLKKTDSFYRFKSKAVYAIYLSYVEVAQKALQHDKIQMAMSYLEQASAIQLKYPQQIINDKYVEKELQDLLKKALDRYKQLLEEGETKDAQELKKGIMGWLKKYVVLPTDS
ncbi:MAG: hypothetical protein B7C24_00645 [Bacteroidetes bacterium 4572_77]|nr:MAG: hypothetical protein B7C24_00645 [Bacteroidetes bacterium 4572_77]